MIDFTNYSQRKDKNLLSVIKAGENYAVSVKRFNPEDGTPFEDEVKEIDTSQKQIDEINIFLRDTTLL